MNYEQDLRIDETALDVEWLDQAMLFMRYARHAAEARKTFDETKQELDIVRAEIDKDIRENPDKYGLEKVTEGAIQSTLLTNKKYWAANQKVLDAKYEFDMASNAVSAFNMRKEALENLVKLNGQQYFAGPQVPRDLYGQRQLRQKDMNSRIGEKMKRTK